MRKIIILFALLITVLGIQCRKKDEIKTTINAHIFVKNTNIPITNYATSLVEYFDTGTHDARTIGEQNTDGNGNVSYKAQAKGNTSLMYYVIFLKDLHNYYGASYIEYPYNEVTNKDIVTKDVGLYEAGHIELKIINSNPVDQKDSIYNIIIATNSFEEISYFNMSSGFLGTNINYSINLKVICEDNINIQYQVRKNNKIQSYFDTINVAKFQTINYNINY